MTDGRLTTLCAVSLLAGVVVTPAAAVSATHKAAAPAHSRATAAPTTVPADPYAGGVPVSASGRFGWHCTINWVPTPADANLRSPYAAHVFDGNVQAFVPPVPPGYKGPIRRVHQEVCRY
jgi:hypothetical protein